MSKNKEQRFKDIIFDIYGGDEEYDKLNYQLLKARSLMLHHKAFDKSNTKEQFQMCLTIMLISIHTTIKAVNTIRVIKPSERLNLKYALDNDYQIPLIISLDKSIEAQ